MNTLLICPVHRSQVSRLSEHHPLVLAPILGKCLLEYWLEYLASRGDRDVRIIASDRPEQIRILVGDGSRWGLRVEVMTQSDTVADIPPDHVVIMDHLPGLGGVPLFESYQAWFKALQTWMPYAGRPERIGRREMKPGISVGMHARVSASAKLHAPCWIGEHCVVSANAVIGPGAILEDRAFVGSGACITQSVIGPETLVGEYTLVEQSLANGNLLINWENRSCLEVPDAFLLSSLVSQPSITPRAPRLVKSPSVTLRSLIPGQQS
jgi:NDP-sugar pyrophosphorylase family protein